MGRAEALPLSREDGFMTTNRALMGSPGDTISQTDLTGRFGDAHAPMSVPKAQSAASCAFRKS